MIRPLALLLVALLWTAAAPAQKKTDKFVLSKHEQELLNLTNAARKKEGLPPLKPNPVLFKVAREHTANMAKQDKLDHVLDEKTPFQRIKSTGYKYRFAGENIGWNGDGTNADVFEGWMNSPPHRMNILNANFTEIGLGRVPLGDGKKFYYTQVFAKPQG